MAHYLVYVPGRVTPAILPTLGLGGLTADGNPISVESPDGPAGPGAIFAWLHPSRPAAVSSLAYQPARQRWEAAKPDVDAGLTAGRYWLGADLESPVTPQDVARDKQYAGIGVPLRDGQRWTVPAARQLPHVWGLGDDGKFAQRAAPGFEGFCRSAERFYAAWQTRDPEQDFKLADAWAYCCEALAVNYRVNEHVVSFLDLIDGETATAIAFATIEIDLIAAVEADQKKTA